MAGKLITLEGIDGVGKTTILNKLKDRSFVSNALSKKLEKFNIIFTREPTNEWIGDVVNKAIRSDVDPLAELFLFMADHFEHISKKIRPAIENNKIVISDRYSDSRIAYQGATLQNKIKNPINWIQSLHKNNTIIPDLTILFDTNPELAVKRIEKNRDENSKFEKIDFLNNVRKNYISIAKSDPNRFKIIDADKPLEKIEIEVVEIISSFISEI